MTRDELEYYTGQLLEVPRFRDSCPNGLQIEGRRRIEKIVTGVTASLDFLKAAVRGKADAVLVHHGYFWRGEDPRLLGTRKARIALLLAHDINLFAYHLPLDAHPELGNNAQLARILDFQLDAWFGEQNVAAHGRLSRPLSLAALQRQVANRLGHPPLVIGKPSAKIRRIAWCSGAAPDWLAQAADLGVDAYLTGEASEPAAHLARETGVALIAAGHHATERFGIGALGEHLAQRFGLEHRFVDRPIPV